MSIEKFKWEILTKKSDSQEDPYVRILHLSRRLKGDNKSTEFINSLGVLDGVEAMQPIAPYSLQIMIARCFNPSEVVANIEQRVGDFLSDIVVPKLVLAK